MRDKVVIIGMADHACEHPSAEPFVIGSPQKVITEKELVHGGRRFDEICGNVCIIQALGRVRETEMARMAQFVGDGKDVRHPVVPGQQDKRIPAVRAGAEAAGGMARALLREDAAWSRDSSAPPAAAALAEEFVHCV